LRRTSQTALLFQLAIALGANAAVAAEPDPIDLVGTWHVLVHYTDSDTANPETVRWDDRLWVFERKGTRLSWTEYPIVVFKDRSGRFERSQAGQRRVLHAWEPNAAQLAQIEAGLEFNTRGSKTKSLRHKKDGGWQSAGAAPVMSASVVGYHETWSISWEDGVPTFTRDDILGAERAESMSGRTCYHGTRVVGGSREIRGDFARDESRRGSFRMRRSGEAQSVGTKRTQRERLRDAFGLDEAVDEGEAESPSPSPSGSDPDAERE
jgi:hypothetical protein